LLPSAADRDEAARLEAVHELDVLDAPRDEGFNRIVRLVRAIFKVPVSFVSIIDAHRQWYTACDGFEAIETPRGRTFCQVTIQQCEPLVIADTKLDPRFADHPNVIGEPFVRFYAGAPLCTRDGHNVGTLCIVDFVPRSFDAEQVAILADIARIAMAQLELRQLVSEDVLTGARSRRAFRQEGAEAMALARRHGYPLSCVTFDLDHFKAINDRLGHAVGDDVLLAVARACGRLLRKADRLGRLGGEEFGIVLPHTGRKGAFNTAEKLRMAIAALKFPEHNRALSVTASFGYTAMDSETHDLDALLARADAALYEAKAGGRNRSVGWRDANGVQARRRVLKAGSIEFNDGRSSIDCTVRTLGDDGGGLDVSSTIGIPDRFTLVVRSDGKRWPCHILSKTERHVEVLFD
jgi:diguanylate cyclase (GGDEF)-like protein